MRFTKGTRQPSVLFFNRQVETEQSSRSGAKIWISLKNVMKQGRSYITFTSISKKKRLRLYSFHSLRRVDIFKKWFSMYEFVLQVQNIKEFKI